MATAVDAPGGLRRARPCISRLALDRRRTGDGQRRPGEAAARRQEVGASMTTTVGGSGMDHVGWVSELHALVDAVNPGRVPGRRGYGDSPPRPAAGGRVERGELFAAVAGDRRRRGRGGRRSRAAGGVPEGAGHCADLGGGESGPGTPRSPAATRPAGRPVPDSRRVRRPDSTSFPSGHSASAFASAAGRAAPGVRLHLYVAAATVAYSRVHTGVHYPSDVAVGAVVGSLCGGAVRQLAPRAATLR
jgi:hypothetical protein